MTKKKYLVDIFVDEKTQDIVVLDEHGLETYRQPHSEVNHRNATDIYRERLQYAFDNKIYVKMPSRPLSAGQRKAILPIAGICLVALIVMLGAPVAFFCIAVPIISGVNFFTAFPESFRENWPYWIMCFGLWFFIVGTTAYTMCANYFESCSEEDEQT